MSPDDAATVALLRRPAWANLHPKRQAAPIPTNADPIVKLFLRRVRGATAHMHVEADAGLAEATTRHWRYHSHVWGPRVGVLRKALAAIGLELCVRDALTGEIVS